MYCPKTESLIRVLGSRAIVSEILAVGRDDFIRSAKGSTTGNGRRLKISFQPIDMILTRDVMFSRDEDVPLVVKT